MVLDGVCATASSIGMVVGATVVYNVSQGYSVVWVFATGILTLLTILLLCTVCTKDEKIKQDEERIRQLQLELERSQNSCLIM